MYSNRAYLLYYSIYSNVYNSVDQVKMWVKELRKMLGSAVQLCIVGNKIDKDKERHVQASAAEQ